MALAINHNLMALNTARNLNTHYQALSVSTRRLSSGLRVGTAADDAAGLAIRELMRADISALNQGVRNANDAVSLLQVADGGLQIIDEKLIRMKELAEQAATGTYGPEQRAMIDSEYQAMAREITRIANSTDFNGIYLLNGNADSGMHDGSGVNSTGKIKIHFGPGNSSAEDYYYIQIGDSRAEALGIGDGSTFVYSTEEMRTKLNNEFESALKPLLESGQLTQVEYDSIMANRFGIANSIKAHGYPEGVPPPDCIDYFWDAETLVFGGTDSHGNTYPPSQNLEGYSLSKLLGNTAADRYDAYLQLPQDEQEKYRYAFGREIAYAWAGLM